MKTRRRFVLVAVLLVSFVPAAAHDPTVEIARIAELMGLRAGMRVADVGAGDGEFAEQLAYLVDFGGHVYANEIDDGELDRIRRRVERSNLSNVTVVEGGDTTANLPEDCCDGIMLRYVFHHFSEPQAMLDSLHRSLREKGILVVIEKLEGGHGISLKDTIEQVGAGGFRLVSEHPEWGEHKDHHAAVFAPR